MKNDNAPSVANAHEKGQMQGVAAVAPCSASEGITPAPWTWEHHPLRDGLMALTAGETDVILPTGDNECVWMDIKPADRALIRRSPELLAAVEDLMQIVEGVRNERWAADGRRLKDTPEWCRLYVLRCAILRGEPNGSDQPPARG